MKIIQILVSALLILIFNGCQPDQLSQNKNAKSTFNYFDLKGFMKEETDRISKMASYTKVVYLNGEEETKKLTQMNLENELKPFSDSDINKPAWAGKYNIDSTFNEKEELVGLVYTSDDKKLKTKKISVDFESGKVIKVFIENAANSTVANTHQALTYQPDIGFSIESKQDVSLLDENYFKIKVLFH